MPYVFNVFSGNLDWTAEGTLPVADTTAIVKGSVDASKLVRLEVDGLTTSTTRVLTIPDQNVDLTPNTGTFSAAAHTARHTDGSDDIQNATAAQKGVATAAQITKLDGIEALADVTSTHETSHTDVIVDGDFTAADQIMVGAGVGTHGQVTLAASQFLAKGAAGSASNKTATEARAILNVEDASVALATVKADTDVASAISLKHTQGTDTALGTVGTKNPPIDADLALYRDSIASNVLVTSTWTQIKAFLKTYFDTLYNKYVHPNHSGDVTSVADGAQTIATAAVTLAKMANMATASILGRNTAGVGVPEVLAKATALSLLNVADGADVTGSNPPQAHAASHQDAGADEVSVAGLSGLLADDQHVLDSEVLAVALSKTGALFAVETELTIATGVITVTQVRHKVDTEADAASDDLVTINGGATVNIIILRAEADARTVVVKHGTGNIWLQGKADISLDDLEDGILLFWDSTNSKWFDIGGIGLAKAGANADITSMTGLSDKGIPEAKVIHTRVVVVKCIADGTALAVADGVAYFTVPIELNGMNLISVGAHVYTVSSSGLPTFQIHNLTDAADMLSTLLTIDASEKDSSTAATPAVINTTYDDVATGDELRFDCDVAGTSTTGMEIRMGFATP